MATAIVEMTCARGHHWFVEAAVYDEQTGEMVFGSAVDACDACLAEAPGWDYCYIGNADHDPFETQVYWGRVLVAEEVGVETEPPEWLQDKWREARDRRIEIPRNPNKAWIAWMKAGDESTPIVWSRSWHRKSKAKV